jgi:hypothetical protein
MTIIVIYYTSVECTILVTQAKVYGNFLKWLMSNSTW